MNDFVSVFQLALWRTPPRKTFYPVPYQHFLFPLLFNTAFVRCKNRQSRKKIQLFSQRVCKLLLWSRWSLRQGPIPPRNARVALRCTLETCISMHSKNPPNSKAWFSGRAKRKGFSHRKQCAVSVLEGSRFEAVSGAQINTSLLYFRRRCSSCKLCTL